MTERAKPLINQRLNQHRENLAGWKEGERCVCVGTAGRQSARPTCMSCGGTGTVKGSTGYLVPTEPDPDERALVRRDLETAIMELEFLKQELDL